MRDQMEKLFHNGAFDFIDGEVIQWTILFPDATIMCQLVAEGWVYPEFCVNVLRECKQQKLV